MAWPRTFGSALIVFGLSACDGFSGPAKATFPHAIMTPQPAKALPTPNLSDASNKTLPLTAFAGRWVWLYFGFTHCPDVCPVAMDAMVAQYKRLKNPKQVQPVFVSVDPNRDRGKALGTFTQFYHPDFVGLTGEKSAIDQLTKAVGATYIIEAPGKSKDDYGVSHSNLIFILNPQGQYVATYVPEEKALADDFNALPTEN